MTETIGSAASGHPDLNLNPDERRFYEQLLKEADPDGFGAVSGDVAVKFFERTKLAPDVLGQIWQVADNQNRGFLTPAGFGVALRLIGHAQSGRTPSALIATQPAGLPRFDGMQTPQASAPAPIPPPAQPSTPVQTGGSQIRVPPLTPDKAAEYAALFDRSGAENGMLSGLTAKQIYERARLPNDILGRIWALSDMQGRGALDVTEFVISMHLLASCKSGVMRGVPNTLPPGLYEAAQRRPPARIGSNSRPASGVPPSMAAYNARPQSPITRQQASTPMSAQSTGETWSVTSADKQRFDTIFATVDKQNRGFITGDQAVEFFSNARLPEEALAQIWDLADINSEGQLNRDEFAVAMYLIRQQRGTRDGRGALPAQLPAALIPPSMRKQTIAPSHTTAPAFENQPPPTKPRSAAEDLFDLEGFGAAPQTQAQAQAPPQVPAQPSQPSQSASRDAGLLASPPPLPPISTGQNDKFRPFQPSSSFGRSIAPTGPQSPTTTASAPSRPPRKDSDDLLGDADPEVSKNITSDTAALANLSNQVTNLVKQTTELQGQRGQVQQDLSQSTAQKRAFETRLASLRELYEREVKEVKTIQEQLIASRNDTKRLQQDMAMVDGTHQDLSTQHQQLRAALEADQKENAGLKERIRQTNIEMEQVKPSLEKLKSDARQQKGLVAINKKQLGTNETERDRLRAELAATQQQMEDARREIEESAKQIETSKGDLERVKAELERSKAELERSRAELGRSKAAVESSKAEFEKSRAELERSRAEQEKSQRELERSQSELETTRKAHSQATQAAVRSPGATVTSPASITSNPFFRTPAAGVSDRAISPPVADQRSPGTDHEAFDSIFGPSFGIVSPPPETSFKHEDTSFEKTPPATTPTIHTAAAVVGSPRESDRDSLPSSEIVEPPAPPQSKQITSAALPFRAPLERDDSVSSSVRVAQPASRLSPTATPRAGSPPSFISTPTAQNLARDGGFGMAAADEEQESVKATLPGPGPHGAKETAPSGGISTERLTDDLPGAFPRTEEAKSTEVASKISPTAVAAGAGALTLVAGAGLVGAATLAAGAGIAAAVTSPKSETVADKPKVAESVTAKETQRPQSGFDDFFGGPPRQRTPSQQAADFDSAFASMTKDNTINGKTQQSGYEFPALQEFDDDDDSSEASEESPMAFDDNFNTASQPKLESGTGMSAKAAGKQPEVASAIPGHLKAGTAGLGTTLSTSSLPGFNQQTSPPAYGDAVPDEDPNHFPREYKGLLPEREDPTSPPPTTGTVPPPSATTNPPYGPETTKPRQSSTSKPTAPAPPATKTSGVDFDSAFAGMGSSPPPTTNKTSAVDFDSAFAGMGSTQPTPATKSSPFDFDSAFSGMGSAEVEESDEDDDFDTGKKDTEFDPNFDSPPQSRSITATSIPTGTSMYSAVTNGSMSTATGATKSTGFHNFEDDFDTQSSSTSAPRATPDATANSPANTNTAHDWDSMFAGLSEPVPTQATQLSSPSAPPTSTTTSVPSAPVPTAGLAAPSKAPVSTSPGPGSGVSTPKLERPQPGRALTAAGEHDDPILKRLISMGWSREDSVKALEKYDYNIDKAADYLTFRT